jgi:hypothetical protein
VTQSRYFSTPCYVARSRSIKLESESGRPFRRASGSTAPRSELRNSIALRTRLDYLYLPASK